MANGKLSKKELIKIMDEARAEAEKELTAAQDYEQFQYAAGNARGVSNVLHSVILAAFGLPRECGDIFNQYTEYAADINKRISSHLQRIIGVKTGNQVSDASVLEG